MATGNYSLSFKLKAPVTNSFGLYIRGANETNNRNNVRLGVSGGGYPSVNIKNGTTDYFEPSATSYTSNTDVAYRMEFVDGVAKCYVEDTLLMTQSLTFTPKYIGIGCFAQHNNLQVSYSDLMIKPL